MNIYGIIYKQDEGFEIIKDKIEYCHSQGYFSTTLGDAIHLCYINDIPEKTIYLEGYDRITFIFLDEKMVRRFFNLMKEKLVKSVDFEINKMQAIKEKIVNSELYYETDD